MGSDFCRLNVAAELTLCCCWFVDSEAFLADLIWEGSGFFRASNVLYFISSGEAFWGWCRLLLLLLLML